MFNCQADSECAVGSLNLLPSSYFNLPPSKQYIYIVTSHFSFVLKIKIATNLMSTNKMRFFQ